MGGAEKARDHTEQRGSAGGDELRRKWARRFFCAGSKWQWCEHRALGHSLFSASGFCERFTFVGGVSGGHGWNDAGFASSARRERTEYYRG